MSMLGILIHSMRHKTTGCLAALRWHEAILMMLDTANCTLLASQLYTFANFPYWEIETSLSDPNTCLGILPAVVELNMSGTFHVHSNSFIFLQWVEISSVELAGVNS